MVHERVTIELNGLGRAALERSPLWKNLLAGLAISMAKVWGGHDEPIMENEP
jgi:hypothetical protein